MSRNFAAKPAVRESVPLLVGLMGPSGSGKTYSALELATGIQSVTGGEIYFIDTEAKRGLHYADQFKFNHIQFDAPFGSLDYLEAIKFCVKEGAKVIVVDSMSHEHEGPGGMINFQEQELDRMAGNDYGKRERMKMLAWQKPKANRRTLINSLLQLNCNFIFCFRAKNTVKPMRVNGKTEIVPQGFMPIAGEEFVFEMTVNCLLLPGSKGIPTWVSENVGEKVMIKPARQFDRIFADGRPLDRQIGKELALWATGSTVSPGNPAPVTSAANLAAQGDAADEQIDVMAWDSRLATTANLGTEALKAEWAKVPREIKSTLKAAMENRHKPAAEATDQAAGAPA